MLYSIAAMKANERVCQLRHNGVLTRGTHAYPGAYGAVGNLSRIKGQRIERELVHRHHAAGIPASRVPLSGAAGGEYAGDLRVLDFTAEVKARKDGSGFKQLEAWLGQHSLLFLRRDRQRPLVVLPWETYITIMHAYQAQRTPDDAAPLYDL